MIIKWNNEILRNIEKDAIIFGIFGWNFEKKWQKTWNLMKKDAII